MWMFIGIVGMLGFLIGIVATIVFVIKQSQVWKKAALASVLCFVLFIVGVANDDTEPVNNTSITQQETQQEPAPSKTETKPEPSKGSDKEEAKKQSAEEGVKKQPAEEVKTQPAEEVKTQPAEEVKGSPSEEPKIPINQQQATTAEQQSPVTAPAPEEDKQPITEPSQRTQAAPENTSVIPPPQDNQEQTVYVTNTGKKYHSAGCRTLKKSQRPISLDDAKAAGYSPCGICNPPQ